MSMEDDEFQQYVDSQPVEQQQITDGGEIIQGIVQPQCVEDQKLERQNYDQLNQVGTQIEIAQAQVNKQKQQLFEEQIHNQQGAQNDDLYLSHEQTQNESNDNKKQLNDRYMVEGLNKQLVPEQSQYENVHSHEVQVQVKLIEQVGQNEQKKDENKNEDEVKDEKEQQVFTNSQQKQVPKVKKLQHNRGQLRNEEVWGRCWDQEQKQDHQFDGQQCDSSVDNKQVPVIIQYQQTNYHQNEVIDYQTPSQVPNNLSEQKHQINEQIKLGSNIQHTNIVDMEKMISNHDEQIGQQEDEDEFGEFSQQTEQCVQIKHQFANQPVENQTIENQNSQNLNINQKDQQLTNAEYPPKFQQLQQHIQNVKNEINQPTSPVQTENQKPQMDQPLQVTNHIQSNVPLTLDKPQASLTQSVKTPTLQDELKLFIKSLPNYDSIIQRSFINSTPSYN